MSYHGFASPSRFLDHKFTGLL
jgi:hypothetical protein